MRKHIPYPQLLAAALRELLGIPYEHAKLMSAEQVISLGHRDHGILHAIEPIDEHWNITWRPIMEHREKSRNDTAVVAKSNRIRRKQAEHDVRNAARMQALVRLGEQRFQTDINNKMDQQLTIYAGKRKTVLQPGETVTVEPTRKGWSIKSRGFDKSRTKGFDGKVRVKAPR